MDTAREEMEGLKRKVEGSEFIIMGAVMAVGGGGGSAQAALEDKHDDKLHASS